ncbi:MAG: hypothetical protein AAFY71_06175 [Bacteroidota bacterium]
MTLNRLWIPIAIAMAGLFLACENQVAPIDLPEPEDQNPAIAITSPTNPRFSGRVGESKSVTLQMGDNEMLKTFTIDVAFYNPDGSFDSGNQVSTETLTGKSFTSTFNFDVASIAPFSRIEYTFTVEDSKGATSTTSIDVSVLPEPTDPPIYRILTYEGDSIMNQLSDSLFGFNFSSRQGYPKTMGQSLDTLSLRMDIMESSGTGQGLWQPTFTSPNNEAISQDSVFVITNAARLNYETADYTSIFEAFFSADQQLAETPVLEQDMYVIVRLVKTPRPQFALLRITKVEDDGAGIQIFDKVFFDYKVTTP